MQKNQRKAFTLLELLVVIAIIGILISLGVASFSNAQRKARDSRRREDIKSVQNGLEQYYADNNGSYPIGNTMSIVIGVAGSDYFPAGVPDDPKLDRDYYIVSDANAYCACAWLEGLDTGNASNTSCNYANGDYFCVSNLQ